MNWKLIFGLSLIGLVMAFATVYYIPFKMEGMFWLPIFIFYAFMIAKNAPGKYFLHGFLVSMVNALWITAVHVGLFQAFIDHNPEALTFNAQMPYHEHPRILMLFMGPLFGAAFGIINGLFAFGASKILKKK